MRALLTTGLSLCLLFGLSCGPKDATSPQPPPRRAEARPKPLRAAPATTDLEYRVGDDRCKGGHDIELVRYHETRGPVSEKKIGCGRVDLPGGEMMNGPLRRKVSAFAMLVKILEKKKKPDDDDPGDGDPSSPGGSDELKSEQLPTYAYVFWGPAGKPFHKAGNMPKIMDLKVVGQRWITYQFALGGAPLRGFTIADSRTGKTIDDSGGLASELAFRGERVFFVLAQDGKYKLHCADLTGMRVAEVATLPELDDPWSDAVKWTAAGKIQVQGKRRDNSQPYAKTFTCGPAK